MSLLSLSLSAFASSVCSFKCLRSARTQQSRLELCERGENDQGVGMGDDYKTCSPDNFERQKITHSVLQDDPQMEPPRRPPGTFLEKTMKTPPPSKCDMVFYSQLFKRVPVVSCLGALTGPRENPPSKCDKTLYTGL